MIVYTTFPKTKKPALFIKNIVDVFSAHESKISTKSLSKGLVSNEVLSVLGKDLVALGFEIEQTKRNKISRPVFYGEMGKPSLRYEIDGYHPDWRCGIEVEAGRGIGGNAIFRDLFQAMVMTDIDHLIIAVAVRYRRKSGGKLIEQDDYKKTVSVAETLYSHDRIKMPYDLTVIGY